jgi:hypothetical protein
MKTTYNGRRPQNIKSWISQQPLNGTSSNFKLKFRGPNKMKYCLKWIWPTMEDDLKILKVEYLWRRPTMEDNLKILKVEYLSSHWSDPHSILNLNLGDQTKIEYYLKWRWPTVEDDLKIFKVEYLSNHWSDLPQILNLS